MAELSAGIVDQQATPGGHPNIWNGGVFQRCNKLVESRRHFSTHGEQIIHITK
jgi:hypothetical protein